MSEQPETQDNKTQKTLNIPSFEQVEKLLANQSKQLPILFKSKRTLEAETAKQNTTSSNTPPPPPPVHNTPPSPVHNTLPPPFRNSPTPTVNILQPQPNAITSNQPIRRITAAGNTILVRPTQQKNPILKHIHNVPWEPSDYIKADFVVGQTTGLVYLSLRYHRLYPTYIYDRLTELQKSYVSRILLVYVDIDSYHDALREINRVAILSDFTLILAWSLEEAGRYLETYKSFEKKAPDLIRERVQDEYLAKMTDCLTQIKSLNKTDVLTLLSTFGSLKQIAEANSDQLAMCPGFGDQKVKRLQSAWKQPFLANKKLKK
ncbi:restriction endonuclease type II-like protein [Pilaira anomala]|nr:restriction endonuclease type II-like protein [Pilaira anomala]